MKGRAVDLGPSILEANKLVGISSLCVWMRLMRGTGGLVHIRSQDQRTCDKLDHPTKVPLK